MPTRGFDLRFDITGPSEDGTFVALCRDLPMILAAASESELRERIDNAVDELGKYLQAMPAGEDVNYLKEAGVKLHAMTGAERETRTVTLPVSLGAATR
ncbi:MAG: hypothetical protein ABI577_17620 [bacterium]